MSVGDDTIVVFVVPFVGTQCAQQINSQIEQKSFFSRQCLDDDGSIASLD